MLIYWNCQHRCSAFSSVLNRLTLALTCVTVLHKLQRSSPESQCVDKILVFALCPWPVWVLDDLCLARQH